jgi:hypothetical protein
MIKNKQKKSWWALIKEYFETKIPPWYEEHQRAMEKNNKKLNPYWFSEFYD